MYTISVMTLDGSVTVVHATDVFMNYQMSCVQITTDDGELLAYSFDKVLEIVRGEIIWLVY